jgi:hypothetical protein
MLFFCYKNISADILSHIMEKLAETGSYTRRRKAWAALRRRVPQKTDARHGRIIASPKNIPPDL